MKLRHKHDTCKQTTYGAQNTPLLDPLIPRRVPKNSLCCWCSGLLFCWCSLKCVSVWLVLQRDHIPATVPMVSLGNIVNWTQMNVIPTHVNAKAHVLMAFFPTHVTALKAHLVQTVRKLVSFSFVQVWVDLSFWQRSLHLLERDMFLQNGGQYKNREKDSPLTILRQTCSEENFTLCERKPKCVWNKSSYSHNQPAFVDKVAVFSACPYRGVWTSNPNWSQEAPQV